MFLNTTLYLVEDMKLLSVKAIKMAEIDNQWKFVLDNHITHNKISLSHCSGYWNYFAQRELNCLYNFGFMIMSVEKSTL